MNKIKAEQHLEPESDVLAFNEKKSIKKLLNEYKGDFTIDLFQELLTRSDIPHVFLSDIDNITSMIAKEFPEIAKVKSIGKTW